MLTENSYSYAFLSALCNGRRVTKKQVNSAIRADGVHISAGNMKVGSLPNFSLTPLRTCSPEACRTCGKGCCYALKSYKQYPAVRTAWDGNTMLALTDLDRLETALDLYFTMYAPEYFRIHVGGDFCSVPYAEMWYRIAKRHSETRFLAYTKQFDIVRAVPFFALSNFALLLSDWVGSTIPTDLRKLYRVAWLNDGSRPAEFYPERLFICTGHCPDCMVCYHSDSRDIVFNIHGIHMTPEQQALVLQTAENMRKLKKA